MHFCTDLYFKYMVLLVFAEFIFEEANTYSLMSFVECNCNPTEPCKCCVNFRSFLIPIPHEACLINDRNTTISLSIDGKVTYDPLKPKGSGEQCLWIRFGTNICFLLQSLEYDKGLNTVKGCGHGEIKFLRTSVFKWDPVCLTFGDKLYALLEKADAVINQVIKLFDEEDMIYNL